MNPIFIACVVLAVPSIVIFGLFLMWYCGYKSDKLFLKQQNIYCLKLYILLLQNVILQYKGNDYTDYIY